MDCCGGTRIPVRVKIRLQALVLWLGLSLPSILVTLILYLFPVYESEEGSRAKLETNLSTEFNCYENYTVYFPVYESARFWIEGVLLVGVGLLGICGNLLTLAVLRRSKTTKFNSLLSFLSLTDTCLIVFFLLMSACTVIFREPRWFVYVFPYLLWPLGNISITTSVLMVVAVSTERFLAICRPLQYKPSPVFYVLLVLLISVAVNAGRFFEYKLVFTQSNGSTLVNYKQSFLLQDERYIIFSRYWTEIVVIGILPLLALIMLNYGIYVKIRKSTKFRKLHDNNIKSGGRPVTYRITQLDPATNHSPASRKASVVDNHHVTLNPSSSSVGGGGGGTTTATGSSSSSGERSTKLLVGIVLVFFVCHVFRLVLQFDAVVHPSILGGQHFEYCMNRGRFPSPVAVWIMTSFNNVFLVLNSSINFVVYCLVGRSFRMTLIDLFRMRGRPRGPLGPRSNINGGSPLTPRPTIVNGGSHEVGLNTIKRERSVRVQCLDDNFPAPVNSLYPGNHVPKHLSEVTNREEQAMF